MKARALLLLLCVLPGCAWARRENRPVWNVFEQHFVPDDQTLFVCTLPLTAVVGLLAILTDTFVAHPIQVADDAWDDAGSLWRDGRPDFEHRYYSEIAFLPVRAVLTPVVLTGSFLGRSMFDIRDERQTAADRAAAAATARAQFAAWVQAIAAGGGEPCRVRVPELDDELRVAIATAQRQANALGRLQLLRLALGSPPVAAVLDPLGGLRDADPAVRFAVLEAWPEDRAVADDLQGQLCQDPDEAVRVLAQRRWRKQ